MRQNTLTRYGSVARAFHWIIALLIIVDLVIGVVAENMPRNAEAVEVLKLLFSIHKTIGVTVLFLALGRIIWALMQPRPVPLHPDRKMETLAAETVHWALYAAIILMPLSGWIMHAAEDGFAPIFWPFGQNLPFVPKSEVVAHVAGTFHFLAAVVIFLSVGAHVAGALKHVIIDRDDTLARMAKGVAAGDASHTHSGFEKLLPILAAAVLWLGVSFGAVMLGTQTEEHADEGDAVSSNHASAALSGPAWTVEEGSLSFTVKQMGAPVTGGFESWNAAIAYDPQTGIGEVVVDIDMAASTLGAITDQVQGPEFFNVSRFSTSRFAGPIVRLEGVKHAVEGELALVGQKVPVTLNFDLKLDGDVAEMKGRAQLDRRDFGLGASYGDESTVGFGVEVLVDLTASLQDE